MTVTESLKRFRKEKKITQKEVAELLRMTHQMYQYYESNGGITGENIKKIAEYYNVSTDYLLGRSDNPNNTNPSFMDKDLKSAVVTLNQTLQSFQKFLEKQIGDVEK